AGEVLRCDVAELALDDPGLALDRRVLRLREPEVDQLDEADVGDDQVLRRDVAVDDAERQPELVAQVVRVVERLAQLARDVERDPLVRALLADPFGKVDRRHAADAELVVDDVGAEAFRHVTSVRRFRPRYSGRSGRSRHDLRLYYGVLQNLRYDVISGGGDAL